MIRCEDNSLYTGFTNDICKRYLMHLNGKGAKYTKSHKPIHLEMAWKCESESGARQLEYWIKHSLTKKQKELLIQYPTEINQQFPKLMEYQFSPLSNDLLQGDLNANN